MHTKERLRREKKIRNEGEENTRKIELEILKNCRTKLKASINLEISTRLWTYLVATPTIINSQFFDYRSREKETTQEKKFF